MPRLTSGSDPYSHGNAAYVITQRDLEARENCNSQQLKPVGTRNKWYFVCLLDWIIIWTPFERHLSFWQIGYESQSRRTKKESISLFSVVLKQHGKNQIGYENVYWRTLACMQLTTNQHNWTIMNLTEIHRSLLNHNHSFLVWPQDGILTSQYTSVKWLGTCSYIS